MSISIFYRFDYRFIGLNYLSDYNSKYLREAASSVSSAYVSCTLCVLSNIFGNSDIHRFTVVFHITVLECDLAKNENVPTTIADKRFTLSSVLHSQTRFSHRLGEP